MKLNSLKDQSYSSIQNHKLRGFVYNCLQNTFLESLHDKRGYKFFCFSNIFSPNKSKEKRGFQEIIQKGTSWNWLISSPNKNLIQNIYENISAMKNDSLPINLGDASFSIDEARKLETRLSDNSTIATATPIVMRIPQQAYANYGIQTELPYLYWRPEIDFNAFIKQLGENLFKKNDEYFGTETEKFPLFEVFQYKKATMNEIVEEGRNIPVHGSIWNFQFNHLSKEQRKILEFGLDCGLGEKNSAGFGFVNRLG